MCAMSTVADICKSIGRGKLAELLGVGSTAISNAVVEGRFPAKWYRVVHKLCVERGLDCPVALFNFVDPRVEADAETTPTPPAEDAA